MPYSRRTGKRYAAGSQSTLAGWEPRECCICGGVVRVTKDNARYDYDHETESARSWHVECEETHGWPRRNGA